MEEQVAPAPTASKDNPLAGLKQVIVAIHGIGSQTRSDTVRQVASRFGDQREPKVPLLPLGYFHVKEAGVVCISKLDVPAGDPRERIGFAEIYWADIPGEVEKRRDTLEESKAWGESILSRTRKTYLERRELHAGQGQSKNAKGQLDAEDFGLVSGALDEAVETVAVLENLCKLAKLGGVFNFDLAQLLRDYLGDVQLVTEFSYYRRKILYRFHDAMHQIAEHVKKETNGEIYIVAHSEGSVVSFLALLQALSGVRMDDPDSKAKSADAPSCSPASSTAPEWIKYVRGFMTIGSPIGKHLFLWPSLWEGLELKSDINQSSGKVEFFAADRSCRLELDKPIRWRNYYDFGDPIGFKLDCARTWLTRTAQCAAFEFEEQHDFGFSRYWLPGQAHNDYWKDEGVFGHFIEDVVLKDSIEAQTAQNARTTTEAEAAENGPKIPTATVPVTASQTGARDGILAAPKQIEAPKSRRLRGLVSVTLPYALSVVCHSGAVFVLLKAVLAYLMSAPPPLKIGAETVALALLLSGVTVAARLPRLLKPGLGWVLAGIAAYSIGTWAYLQLMPAEASEHLQSAFGLLWKKLTNAATSDIVWPPLGMWILPIVAAAIASTGWWIGKKPHLARRVLVLSGTACACAIVVGSMLEAGTKQSIWPVVLAGGGFVYLWWLGILLFDLTFMWHRYVRNSVIITNLKYWCEGKDAPSGVDRCAQSLQKTLQNVKEGAHRFRQPKSA